MTSKRRKFGASFRARVNRATAVVLLSVAVVASTLTFVTGDQYYTPNYGGGVDFDGYGYGFPFHCLYVPERSGSLSIDPVPLIGDLVTWVIIGVAVEITRRRVPSWQFSLRRLLLAVAFWGLACGCFRLASVNDIRAAIIPGVLSLGLGIGLLTNHVLIACTVVAALAYFSAEGAHCDGRIPPGEVRLQVCDESQSPLRGVRLDVQPGRRTHEQPNASLVREYEELPLLTDGDGRVVFHTMGYRYSGDSCELFWCIRIGWRPPKFDCCLSKEGYTSLQLPFRSLLDPRAQLPTTTNLIVDGHPWQLPVYAHRVTMRQERAD